MNDNEGKFVNTLLAPDELEKFEAIKRYHGIKNSSDTVRFLIQKEARNLFESAPLFAAPSPAQES